jgi:hypothetical protein
MILILSSYDDISTNDIIDWLRISWCRINKNYLIREVNVDFNKLTTEIVFDNSIQLNYLYRRDDFSIKVNIEEKSEKYHFQPYTFLKQKRLKKSKKFFENKDKKLMNKLNLCLKHFRATLVGRKVLILSGRINFFKTFFG